MSLPLRLLSIALLWLTVACAGQAAAPPPFTSTPSTAASADAAYPRTPAEAEEMKKAGRRWADCDIRIYYNRLVAEIPARDATLIQEGKSAEERAHAAYEARHNARITARAMMESAAEVEALRARDQEKYGNPDGPTFEQLVKKNRDKGLEGDAVFEAIIASSQRTDESVNEECGIESSR